MWKVSKLALQPQSPDFLRLGGSHGQCAGQYLRYLSTKTIGCAISTACVYGGTAALTVNLASIVAGGPFWTETTVSGLMHLRAAFKAGRWDEVMLGVLTGTFQTPRFAPVSQAATHRSAEAQQRDTPQSFIKSRKQAA